MGIASQYRRTPSVESLIDIHDVIASRLRLLKDGIAGLTTSEPVPASV